MAEVLATMVVGPLVSMVKEKASSYLLDQYKVMEGMEEQHKLLKRKLPAVLDVITDAEEQAAKNREGAKAWLEELRNVAYKANDVLDEFKYEALRRKAKAEGHYKEFGMDVIKLFPSHNRFVFRYRMSNKLRMILQEIDVLIAEMNSFRFKFKPQPPMSLKWRQTDPDIPDHSVNIASESRANEKKEIVGTLLGQGGNVGLTVLPIVGMGGMGKTTLAQLVYNDTDIQNHFQVRLWVCVSENFDADSLVELIVKEAKKNGYQMSEGSALEKFKSAVSGRRYLLVLDDIWNRDAYKWEKLRSYIHHGGTGSSVVTTTRDEYIAQFTGTIKAHKIKGLDLSYIETIIKTRAFSSEAQGPNDELLETMIGDVVKRCSGSPLAATALGSVLRTKNTVQEWEAVLNRSTICDEENGILTILKLSYNCLPPHMRQCFAFCAMFPKDHEIDVEMLIRLWMANSFIPEQQGVCPEVTGKQIFNELAQRSFFQEVKQVGSEKHMYSARTTCKIHDLMHDVAQDSMGKECAIVDTELKQSEGFPYSARHLFLSVVDIPGNGPNASQEKGYPAIQTLICEIAEVDDSQHLLPECRSVRALKTTLGSSPSSFLEPKYLHHLRYLDLSGSDMEAVPEEITILYHLQTLNLCECYSLEQLPMAMKYMTGLRHLYTDRCPMLKGMPPNLRCLTSLQTLTCFVASTDSGCSNIRELEKLDLGGQLELSHLENVTEADAKAANLGDKRKLEELELSWGWATDHDMHAHEKVLEGLKPHDGLKALRMGYYRGRAFPTWMIKLQGMVELNLQDCKNLEMLPALWELPALKFLYLVSLENLHCIFSGGPPSKFQKLEIIVLEDMPKLVTWWDTNEVQAEPIFPKVEYLRIKDCPELNAFPEAPKLSKLFLSDCSEEAPIQAARRYITSLSSMEACNCYGAKNIKQNWKEEVDVRGQESPMEVLELRGCQVFFTPSRTLDVWECFGKLACLKIQGCDDLKSWPEDLFRGLVSLRTLKIKSCPELTGRTNNKSYNEQSAAPERPQLPCLESLEISDCESLEQVPNLWAPRLKMLCIYGLDKLSSMVFGQQDGTRPADTSSSLIVPVSSSADNHYCFFPCLESLIIVDCCLSEIANLPPSIKTLEIRQCHNLVSLSGKVSSLEKLSIRYCWSLQSLPNGPYSSLRVLEIRSIKLLPGNLHECFIQEQVELDSKAESMSDGASTAHVLLKQSSSTSSNHCLFPRLESLTIDGFNGLTKVANLPRSIKTLNLIYCQNLVSLSAEVPLLEELKIWDCKSLESLPNGPAHQAYSALRVLQITECRGIKQLPPSLQQRLDHLEEKDLDLHLLQGPAEPVPTGRIAALMSKLACFRSRGEERRLDQSCNQGSFVDSSSYSSSD